PAGSLPGDVMHRWVPYVLAAAVLSGAPTLPAARSQDKVDFQRDVRPLLSNRCFKCHGPAVKKSGLRLDLRESATNRKAIAPGQPDPSKLLRQTPGDDDSRMPPPEAGDRLKPAQVALLKKWIEEGAEYTPHWAFVTPKRPEPPAVKDAAWVRNPI